MTGRLGKKIEEWLAENRTFLWTVMSHKEMADTNLRGMENNPELLLETCERIESSLDEIKTQLRRIYTLLYEIMDEAAEQVANREGEKKEVKPMRRPPALTVKQTTEIKKEVASKIPDIPTEKTETPQNNTPPQKPSITTIDVPIVEPPPVEERLSYGEEQEGKDEGKRESPAPSVGAGEVKCDVLDELDRKGAEEVETAGIVLSRPKEPGGLLGFLGLWDWFWSLDPERRVKAVSIMCEGGLEQFDIFERKITTLRPSFARYCWETANRLMQYNLDELATGLLIKGLTIVDTRHDKEMLHIMFAKYFYRRRHKLKDAYNACINHCMKVIRSYKTSRDNRSKPVAPFKLLTMIYEEIGEYDKILEICEEAIKLYEGTVEKSKAEGFKRIKEILLQRMGRR